MYDTLARIAQAEARLLDIWRVTLTASASFDPCICGKGRWPLLVRGSPKRACPSPFCSPDEPPVSVQASAGHLSQRHGPSALSMTCCRRGRHVRRPAPQPGSLGQ